MKVMARSFAIVILLELVAVIPAAAQSTTQQNPPAPPAKQPGTPAAAPAAPAGAPAPPPVNKEEEDAYKAFYDSKDSTLVLKLGDEFTQKFPTSRYLETVYSKLARTYQATGQEEKMFSTGEKVLSMNPDNVDMLVMLCWAIPRRLDTKALDVQQKLTKAEQYSKRAQEILASLTKPEHLSEEEFTKGKNESLSMAHSGLGLVYFYRGRLTDAVTEFEQATKISASPDPADFYLSGVVLNRIGKFSDAADSFGKCADAPSAVQDACKQGRDEAKKKAAAAPGPPKP